MTDPNHIIYVPYVASTALIDTWQGAAVNNTSLTTYTFTSQPFGAADPERRVIVAITGSTSTEFISSMTIGGVTAERAGACTMGTTNTVEFWLAWVPTGTTGTVTAVWTGDGQNRCAIGIWTVIGDVAVYGHLGGSLAVAANSANITLNTSTDGFVLIASHTNCPPSFSPSPTPRGAVQDAVIDHGVVNSVNMFASAATTTATLVVGVDNNGNSNLSAPSIYIAVAFGPRPLATSFDAAVLNGAWSLSRNLLSRYNGPFYASASGEVTQIYNQFPGQASTASGNWPSGNFTDSATSAWRPPLITAGPNSRACASFDGTVDQLHSTTIDNYVTGPTGYMAVSIIPDAITVADGSYPQNDHCIIGDDLGYMGLFFRNTGSPKTALAFNWNGFVTWAQSNNITVGTAYVVEWWHESGLLYVCVNNGTPVSVSSSNTQGFGGRLSIGRTGGGSSYSDCKVFEVVTAFAKPANRSTIAANMMTHIGA